MLESRAERALGAAPDIATVGVGLHSLCPKTYLVTELLKNHTSKQTNGPSTISASDF